LLLVIGAAVALFGFWRSSGEPEAYQEQRQLLEQRSPDQRQALAEQTRQRLRDLLRQPASPTVSNSVPRSRPTAETAPPAVSAPPEPFDAPPALNEPAATETKKPRAPGDSVSQPGREASSEESDQEEKKEGVRRITLRLDELNALLEQEASRWMAEQGSDQLPLSNPTLAIEEDHLILFVQLSTPASTVLLGLPFQATVDETGGAVHLLGVRLGQLPLPGVEALPRMLRAAKDPRLDRLAEKAETAAAGYPIEPRLELGDGRALWVLDAEIDPEEQAVHLLVEEN